MNKEMQKVLKDYIKNNLLWKGINCDGEEILKHLFKGEETFTVNGKFLTGTINDKDYWEPAEITFNCVMWTEETYNNNKILAPWLDIIMVKVKPKSL